MNGSAPIPGLFPARGKGEEMLLVFFVILKGMARFWSQEDYLINQ